MKKIILFILFTLISCSDFWWGHDDEVDKYIDIIVKNHDSKFPITKVLLRDYKFENLNIKSGTSLSFELIDGLNDPLENVSVNLTVDCSPQTPIILNKLVDFSDGFELITAKDRKPNNTLTQDCNNIIIE